MKVTIENAGRACVVIAFGLLAGVLAFVLWAVLDGGMQ